MCDAEAAAFAHQLRNPPAEMVIRDHFGHVTIYRIPKSRSLPHRRRAR